MEIKAPLREEKRGGASSSYAMMGFYGKSSIGVEEPAWPVWKISQSACRSHLT